MVPPLANLQKSMEFTSPPTTQQQQAEVAPDQKEDKKCPDTPPLILDDATPQNSDASGPSYSSTFQQDIMQNLWSGTRSGRKFLAHEVLVSFGEELSWQQSQIEGRNR